MMVPENTRVPLLGVGLLDAKAAPPDVIASRRNEDGLGIIPLCVTPVKGSPAKSLIPVRILTGTANCSENFSFCDQFLEVLYEFTSTSCRLARLLVRAAPPPHGAE
jgi:hypothetical protein